MLRPGHQLGRSSVRESDLARVCIPFHSTARVAQTLDPRVVMLRDPAVTQPAHLLWPAGEANQGRELTVFVAGGDVHVVSHSLNAPTDPFILLSNFAKAARAFTAQKLDAAHVLLGYEMCKAATAVTLGKQYTQDESLDWGLLTQPETRHYLKPHRHEANDAE